VRVGTNLGGPYTIENVLIKGCQFHLNTVRHISVESTANDTDTIVVFGNHLPWNPAWTTDSLRGLYIEAAITSDIQYCGNAAFGCPAAPGNGCNRARSVSYDNFFDDPGA